MKIYRPLQAERRNAGHGQKHMGSQTEFEDPTPDRRDRLPIGPEALRSISGLLAAFNILEATPEGF